MKKYSFKNNKLFIAIGALSVITLIGIVYAAFTGQLQINGTANVRDSKWDIHIVEEGQLDPTNITGSAKVLTKPNASTTSISDFALSLTTPGDYIEYTFNVINEGDYDAEISTLTKNGVTCTANGSTSDESAVKVCNKLEYTLKYEGGSDVSQGDTLLSKETKTMILKIKYQEFDDPTFLPTTNVSISGLGINITYAQKGSAKVNADGTTPYVKAYAVGDRIRVTGDTTGDYYRVIAPSGTNQDYVLALKENPLTVSEVNTYGGVGTANNHVNQYAYYSQGIATDQYGYGGMQYYSSPTCGYSTPGDDGSFIDSGCTTSYNASEIKYVVDGWSQARFTQNQLKIVDDYAARLIKHEELTDNLGYAVRNGARPSSNGETPTWVYNSNYIYWTMSQMQSSRSDVWYVNTYGSLWGNYVCNRWSNLVVRPVINVYKSAIQN